MADLATTAGAPPAGNSLLDSKMKKSHAWISGAIVVTALLGGLGYIGFNISQDLNTISVTSYWPYVLLGVALLIALGFEFVNGFHDTANAVATVIYTHSLDPNIAVVWSGFCNLAGVLVSSGAVAFSVITLLPVELILQVSSGAGFAMVFALLIAAIIWNLSTWWFGLPASSSHTMVGSIIGVGVANQLMNAHTGTSGVDWEQATKVFKVLLISPIVGFTAAGLLFLLSKWLIKYPALYEAPKDQTPPPWPIRALLILTCSGVSFSHGSNDGQKGMGLIMLILIGTVPTAYALNHAVSTKDVAAFVAASDQTSHLLDSHVDKNGVLGADARTEVTDYIRTKELQPDTMLALRELVEDLGHEVALYKEFKSVPVAGPEQRPQRHVRGQRRDPADAEDKEPCIHGTGKRHADELPGQGGQGNQVHSRMGEGCRGTGAGHGHDGGLEADRRHGWREDRQGTPDLRPGRLRGAGGHGNHFGGRQLWAAGKYNACFEFGRGGDDGGESQRFAGVDPSQHCGGMGIYAAGGGSSLGDTFLAFPASDSLS